MKDVVEDEPLKDVNKQIYDRLYIVRGGLPRRIYLCIYIFGCILETWFNRNKNGFDCIVKIRHIG